MNAKIILKHDESEYLLQRTEEYSLARSVLAAALPDENQPALVILTCNERAADTLLQVAEPHCGAAWRAMHYQMVRLGLLSSDRFDQTAWYKDNRRHPECHISRFDDREATQSIAMPRPLPPAALCDQHNEGGSLRVNG
jgi:hypothetical protein